MNLPTKLASLRKQKGLTQLELAEKLNISRQAVSRWEAGSAVPSTDNLKILSDLYSVSVDYLLNDAADAFCMNAANQEPMSKEQAEKNKGKKRWVIIAGAAALLLVIAAIFFAAIANDREQEHITPIGDMDWIEGTDYPTYTFSLE